MAFHVRDRETDTLVRKLANREGVGITDAIRIAVGNELARSDNRTMHEKIAEIRARIATYRKAPDDGMTDKEFSDWLNDE